MQRSNAFSSGDAANQDATAGRLALVIARERAAKAGAVVLRLTSDCADPSVVRPDAHRAAGAIVVGETGNGAHPSAKVAVVRAEIGAVAIGRAESAHVMTVRSHGMSAPHQQRCEGPQSKAFWVSQFCCLLLGQSHVRAGWSWEVECHGASGWEVWALGGRWRVAGSHGELGRGDQPKHCQRGQDQLRRCWLRIPSSALRLDR